MPRKTPPSMLATLRAALERLRSDLPACRVADVPGTERASPARHAATLSRLRARARDAPPGCA